MKREKKFATVLLLILIDLVNSEQFYNLVNREDPCINLCEETPLSLTNSKYVKSCCQRGCRFFNLVDLRYGLEPNSLNGTRDACKASCTEAYIEPQDRYACSTGCEFMALQRISDLLSLCSEPLIIEEGGDSNIFLMSPDIPENDILTDPGLKKELFPGWWDSNGFKLPQTYIKTVPLDAGTVDYGIPSDYSGENEASASVGGSDWLQCASRHIGIPHWFFASAFVIGALAALWPCHSSDKVNDSQEEILVKNTDICPKVTMYMPDEMQLHKEAPPKYSEIMGTGDTNIKI